MAKKIDPILQKLLNGEIDIEQARSLAESNNETRGRKKKILTEHPDLSKLLKEADKAEAFWTVRALWLRLGMHQALAISEKKKIINGYSKKITGKTLEREITIANKLMVCRDIVIKIGLDSVVIGTDRDFEISGFCNDIGVDMLRWFYHIDTGLSVPSSIDSLKVFVSRSVFFKFREGELGI